MKLVKIFNDIIKNNIVKRDPYIRFNASDDEFIEVMTSTVAYRIPKERFMLDLTHENLAGSINKNSIFQHIKIENYEKATIVGYNLVNSGGIKSKEILVAKLKINQDNQKEEEVWIDTKLLKNFDKDIELHVYKNDKSVVDPVLVFENSNEGRILAGIIMPLNH